MHPDPQMIVDHDTRRGRHRAAIEDGIKELCIRQCLRRSIPIGDGNIPNIIELLEGFNQLEKDTELYRIFDLYYNRLMSLQEIADASGMDEPAVAHLFAQARDKIVEAIIAYRINSLDEEARRIGGSPPAGTGQKILTDAERVKRRQQAAIEETVKELCIRECRRNGITLADDNIPSLDELFTGFDELQTYGTLSRIFSLHYSYQLSFREIASALGLDEEVVIYEFGNARNKIVQAVIARRIRTIKKDMH